MAHLGWINIEEELHMATEKKMLAALDAAVAAVTGPKLRRADASALCDEYKKIKKWIAIFLPLIGKIPVIGPKIVAIVEFLMSIADTICPTLSS
jgi:hypothetical protein